MNVAVLVWLMVASASPRMANHSQKGRG